MRLEKLVLQGFKSFADRTEFVIQPGLTAFIGPNGCGKSNLVDAVKWVLGEQSVKALRGNEMQDIIFSGTPTRRSLGYAEVTLTLSNTKGILPTDYETISVTRRLYRSGESEYCLNKQRCRLRDIRELFMDTGIGMDAYSIIEQGKVEVLLTSNKQDRRAIFEEAAGISKYKAQKRTCLAKLDRVDVNLTRLTDIIDEVEKRTRSVKYQAAKARRWKRLEDERRELSVALALHDYDRLVKDRDATAGQLAELDAASGGLHAAIERMEAEQAQLDTAATEADQVISKLESEDVRIASQLRAAEEAIRMNEQRISEQDDIEEAAKAEIAKTGATLEMMRGELDRSIADVAGLEKTIAAVRAELGDRRAAFKEIESKARTLRDEIEDKRARALDLASERAGHNNELSAIAAQRETVLRQDQRLADRLARQRNDLAECSDSKAQLARRVDELGRQSAALEQDRRAADAERGMITRRMGEISEEMNARRSEITSANSRFELLADLEEKHEGVSTGVRCLLEAGGGESPEVRGICGVVADVIEVDVEHSRAIEAALGPNEQVVITESFDAMMSAIDFLGRGEKGRARLLAIDAGDGRTVEMRDYAELPEVVGCAIDLMRHPPRFGQALRHLLGDVLVVRDIHAARRLAATNGQGVRYATLDGQLLDPRGVSVGGAARASAGIISRRSELRALDARRATLEADMAVLEKRHAEHAEGAAWSEETVRQLVARIGRSQTEMTELQAKQADLDASIGRIESELGAGESERAENASLLESLDGRAVAVQEEAGRAEQAESELQAALGEQQELLGASEVRRDRLRDESAELEIALAAHTQNKEALSRRIDELGRQLTDGQKSLERAREQAESCVRRRREANEAILAKKAETQVLLERRGKLGAERAEASNRRELVRVQLDAKREERTAAGRRAKEADAKLNELNVHATKIAMRIENLEGRTDSEYGCSLAEEHRKGDAQERDWDEVGREIESVNQKITSLGPVNAYAIEELEELEQRAAELNQQRGDLQKAEQTLKEIIRKINRRSREMFRKTFDDVRENFQGLFRKLFGGGRADIVLDEETDILDAGIEIVACPPGKEPTSITLLSGGEKALTAVALLFAVFRSKPSPFCILDEVDAALDESNIDRFTMLVREFLEDSQFLVITHSRRTMAMADALYGITMQEPGVSTQVSVKFSDDSEMKVA